jgi:hypothetical protein
VFGDTEGCYLAAHTVEDLAAKLGLALAFGRCTDGRRRVVGLHVGDEAANILRLPAGVGA